MFNFDVFFKKFRRGEIYFDNFPSDKQLLFKNKTLPLLHESIEKKDEDLLSSTLAVLFYDGADIDYTEDLLKLLKVDWHILEEDIIQVLEIIKDPKSIETLYELALFVPDYDEMRSLAKKCLYALSAINTKESIEKIKILSTFDDDIIRENALMILSASSPDGPSMSE